MRKFLLASSVIGTIGMSASLMANKFEDMAVKSQPDLAVVQVAGGVIDFKNLHKKRGFVEIKYAKDVENKNRFCNVAMANMVDLKLSKEYKDISFTNMFLPFKQQRTKIVGVTTSIGYLSHDSLTNGADINNPLEVKTQKAPYFAIGAIARMRIPDTTILLGADVDYKMALDRADMSDGYGAKLSINYNRFNLVAEHKKFNFRGADNQSDNSIKVSYAYVF